MSSQDLREFLTEKEISTDFYGEILYELAWNLDRLDQSQIRFMTNKIIADIDLLISITTKRLHNEYKDRQANKPATTVIR